MFFVGILILNMNHLDQTKNLEDMITCVNGGRASGDGPVTHPLFLAEVCEFWNKCLSCGEEEEWE